MQCLFLFKDAAGRLPTAQDLRRCGFLVSEAALPGNAAATACEARDQSPAWPGMALAAEPTAVYGDRVQKPAPANTSDRAQDDAQDGARDGAEGILRNQAHPPDARADQERLHGPPQPRQAG